MNEQYPPQEPHTSLPQPVETNAPSHAYERDQTKAVETGAVSPSAAPSVPVIGSSSNDASQTASQPVSSSSPTASLIADDVDLIEKEWVERAKRIVEHTKNDPYRQSEELHSAKDDYQMKRFNKESHSSDGR